MELDEVNPDPLRSSEVRLTVLVTTLVTILVVVEFIEGTTLE